MTQTQSPQWAQALQSANAVRTERAFLKRMLKGGDMQLVDALEADAAQDMMVLDLLGYAVVGGWATATRGRPGRPR